MKKTIAAFFVSVFSLPGLPALPAAPDLFAAQVSFEQTTRDLGSSDPTVRMHAVRLLKEAAYPEAAVPLARLVTDQEDDLQLEAIAAELNIFLAEKIVPKKRVGLVIEVRNKIAAEAAFSSGPFAVGSRPVPAEVLTALGAAAHDENPRVALEAVYTFGTLAGDPTGSARRELLHVCGPHLAAMIGARDPALRFAAVRVIGRVFGKRPKDEAVDQTVGDAVIAALNDKERAIRGAAMEALGALRYDRAVQAITDPFQYHGRGEVAEAALDVLAHVGHASSAPVLVAELARKNAALKLIAIEGLARMGDRALVADIQLALAGERDEAVLLAGSFASVLLSDGTIEPIAEALTRPKLRDQARQYLIEIAPGHVAAFAGHTQDPDARLRTDLADALGLSDDPAALPIVEPMLRDRDPRVARAAERAVARLRAATRRPS